MYRLHALTFIIISSALRIWFYFCNCYFLLKSANKFRCSVNTIEGWNLLLAISFFIYRFFKIFRFLDWFIPKVDFYWKHPKSSQLSMFSFRVSFWFLQIDLGMKCVPYIKLKSINDIFIRIIDHYTWLIMTLKLQEKWR